MRQWLNIVGIGQDGLAGLSNSTKFLLGEAEVIFGNERHHKLTSDLDVKRIYWPKPFDSIYKKITSYRGKNVVVLVTGDPLWFSAGVKLKDLFDHRELMFHPHVSAFQCVAARMIWPITEVETLSVHGRPLESIIPFIQPNQKLIVLTSGSETPKEIAKLLTAKDFGNSKMTVFSSMCDENEKSFFGEARNWTESVPAFNTLAIECLSTKGMDVLSRTPGLPDYAFETDGTMTKQEVRAVTIAKLKPIRGGLLWDIGCGCGTIAIEWMRAASDSAAIGIDKRKDRCELTSLNAINLGVPDLKVIEGQIPESLYGLDEPDAIFIGGGFSKETFEFAWSQLKPLGRLVVNVVTLESEAILLDIYSQYGGNLTKLVINRAEPIGNTAAWKSLMPVMQWSIEKS